MPRVPQQRYCGKACQDEAARWRAWTKQRRYRTTEKGRQRRREQSRRYHKKRKLKEKADKVEGAGKRRGHREGNHPAGDFKKFPCDRPGCYELYVRVRRSPLQRFCSCGCRKALRRVVEREIRWGLRGRRQRE